MTRHVIGYAVLVAAVAAVSAGGAMFGVLTDADPAALATWAGSSGLVGYVAFRVWSDSRAMNVVQDTLRARIDEVTEDRDRWRTRCERMDAEVLRLSIELAQHE